MGFLNLIYTNFEMVKRKGLSLEILEGIERIEDSIGGIEKTVATGQEVLELFNQGLRLYKENLLKKAGISKRNKHLYEWSEKIRNDGDLRYPHRKILDFLSGQWDLSKNQFKEVHFSKIVKEAHVGKSKTNSYLSLLERKGYIQKRDDGYRRFFKIRVTN